MADMNDKMKHPNKYDVSTIPIYKPPYDFERGEMINLDMNDNYLIEDLLYRNNIAMLYGESSAGKSFLAMDFMSHILTGNQWQSKDIEKVGVLHIALEGGVGAKKRAYGFNLSKYDNYVLYRTHYCIADADMTDELIIKIDSDDIKNNLGLIVIDTLSASLSGLDENSNADMEKALKQAKILAERYNACVLLIHHPNKKTGNARGASSIFAACDTVIKITKNNDNRKMEIEKQKDGEILQPIGFKLNPITLGTSKKGKSITSCIVEYCDIETKKDNKRKSTKNDLALKHLKDLTVKKGQSLPDDINNDYAQSVKAVLMKDFKEYLNTRDWFKTNNKSQELSRFKTEMQNYDKIQIHDEYIWYI